MGRFVGAIYRGSGVHVIVVRNQVCINIYMLLYTSSACSMLGVALPCL